MFRQRFIHYAARRVAFCGTTCSLTPHSPQSFLPTLILPRRPITHLTYCPYSRNSKIHTTETLPDENIVPLINSTKDSFGPLHDQQQHPLHYRGWNQVLRAHFRPSSHSSNDYATSKATIEANGAKAEIDHAEEIITAITNGGWRMKGLSDALSRAPPEYLAFMGLGLILIYIQDEYSDGNFGDFDFDAWADGHFRRLMILFEKKMKFSAIVESMEKKWDNFENIAIANSHEPKHLHAFSTKAYIWSRDLFFPDEFRERAEFKQMKHEREAQLELKNQKEVLGLPFNRPSQLFHPQDSGIHENLLEREELRDQQLAAVDAKRMQMIHDNHGMPLTGSQQYILKEEYRRIATEFADLDLDMHRIENLLDKAPQRNEFNKNDKKNRDKFANEYIQYAQARHDREIQAEMMQTGSRLAARAGKGEEQKSNLHTLSNWASYIWNKTTGAEPEESDFDEGDDFQSEQYDEYSRMQREGMLQQQKQWEISREHEYDEFRRAHADRYRDQMRAELYGIHLPPPQEAERLSHPDSDYHKNVAETRSWWSRITGDNSAVDKKARLAATTREEHEEYERLSRATLMDQETKKSTPFTTIAERDRLDMNIMRQREEEAFYSRQRQQELSVQKKMSRDVYQQNEEKRGKIISMEDYSRGVAVVDTKKEDEHEKRLKSGIFGRLFG